MGSSAGSLVAAAIGMYKYEEIPYLFHHETVFSVNIVGWKGESMWDRLKNMCSDKIPTYDDFTKMFARHYCHDYTFKEVYEKNGWIINITVTDEN